MAWFEYLIFTPGNWCPSSSNVLHSVIYYNSFILGTETKYLEAASAPVWHLCRSYRCTSSFLPVSPLSVSLPNHWELPCTLFHVLISHCFFCFCLVCHIICLCLHLTVHQWLLDTTANRNPKLDVRPWKAWALRLRNHERRWSPAGRAPGVPVPRVHYR